MHVSGFWLRDLRDYVDSLRVDTLCKLWQVLSINIVNIKLSHFIKGFFFHFTVIFSYTEQIRLLLHTFTDWHADSFESFIIKFICLRPTIKFCCCLFISVTDVQLHLVVEYLTELASISVEKNIRYFSNTNLLLHRLLKTSFTQSVLGALALNTFSKSAPCFAAQCHTEYICMSYSWLES